MAKILKGAPVATTLMESLLERTEKLKANGVIPTLAILRVGERLDDIAYEAAAIKRCIKVGISIKQFLLPTNCSKNQIIDIIRRINDDISIHGCLILRPLPSKTLEQAICAHLAPEKDIDGITAGSLVGILTGQRVGYPPCTAQACIEILDYYNIQLQGKRVAVIGRSLVIGKPVSMMLQARNATVTMCHTKTVDLPGECCKSELLIVATGRARMVDNSYVSSGQIIIDVGVNVDENGGLCGDVKFDTVEPIVAAITPVPGGVGAVTTAVLCKHVIEAAEQKQEA